MYKKLNLLVVDDDKDFASDFSVLGKEIFNLSFASTGEEALSMLSEDVPDGVILDLRLGAGIDGLGVLKEIRLKYHDLPVIMVTDFASVETAVEAMKLGAFHYMSKHPSMKELHAIIQKELQNVGWKSLFLNEVRKNYGELVGSSDQMKKVYEVISRAAPVDINVLVAGESGTGKELVAREIHGRSKRVNSPFIAVNCAAIPDTLFETTLFGHEKGSFTGAVGRKKGLFEIADHGTIFLDEICSLSIRNQAKLLRVIEDKKIVRVGGTDEFDVDVRIISASNKNLEKEKECGKFREDLYYRISTISVNIPPLRERKEDIPELASYFAKRLSMEMCKKCPKFTKEALSALKKYNWPGNVRELRNVIERALVVTTGKSIGVSDLNLISDKTDKLESIEDMFNMPYYEAREKVLSDFKKKYLSNLIEKNNGNISKAAKQAGISRSSIHRMIKDAG